MTTKFKYMISAVCLLISATTFAQDYDSDDDESKKTSVKKTVKVPSYPLTEVKGVCLDAATKAPLSGIMIKALGYDNYTAMSDEQGCFTIKVPTYATSLYAHAPEYLSQQVALGTDKEIICIQMLADKFLPMYERTTKVGAYATTEIQNTTSQSIETDIENLIGGDIRSISRSGGPGYGSAMFIRGLNSLNANAQPLIVVDGIVQDMQQTRSTLHYGDYINLMLNINPEDVEKVTVLKNATAIYGAKGANGVILIDTKRGHSLATRIDANIGIGVVLEPSLPKMMNASQYRLYATEMLGSYPEIQKYTVDSETFPFLSTNENVYPYRKYMNNTDWTNEVYHSALTQNYNINVQGGDNIGMYNLSLGYTDAQSTARKNGFNRLNVRFNTDINVVGKLTTKFDMSYTKVNRDVFDNGTPSDFTSGTVSSPTLLALIKSPFLNPYTYYPGTKKLSPTLDEADDFLTMLDQDLSLGNPTALLANGSGINKNRVETTHFNAVIAPHYEFSPSLNLTETFSYSLDRISQRYYRPVGGMPTFLIDGIGRVQSMAMSMFSKETGIQSDTRLEWKKVLGKHSLNVFGGMRFNTFSYDNNQPKSQISSGGNDKSPKLDGDFIEVSGANDTWKSITWYANANYNYRQLYFIEAALSMESSSRFGSEATGGINLCGVRWGLFPSVQAGWVMTNEKWFPRNMGINYFLLRAGFDLSGNDDINNYAARTSFGVTKYLSQASVAQLNNIGNEKISWEKTSKMNLGFRTWLLNNRLGIDFDYYLNHTSDLLTLKSFDNPVAGINNYWSNGGSLDNTGFELTVTTKPIVSRKLNLEVGASVGHYVNKVKTLPNNNNIYVGGKQKKGYATSIYGTDNIATIIGQPLGMFYGYRSLGVFSSDSEARVGQVTADNPEGYLYLLDKTGTAQYFKAGDVHFKDINEDGIIDEKDKTIIGNPNPDIYGNIFANLKWEHFCLYLGLNYSLGNDVYNYQRSILEGGTNFFNQTTAMTNRWRAEGQQTNIPRASYGDPMGNSRFSDRWIEDGSYLRLKTVRLSYQVPVNFTWLQGLTVWAEGNNLVTLTRYVGSDPESSASNSVLYQGIDTGNIALSPTFTFGLKINL